MPAVAGFCAWNSPIQANSQEAALVRKLLLAMAVLIGLVISRGWRRNSLLLKE
jgi:hypothetical protein